MTFLDVINISKDFQLPKQFSLIISSNPPDLKRALFVDGKSDKIACPKLIMLVELFCRSWRVVDVQSF